MASKPSVLVLQSCRPGTQPAWLAECLLSVRAWVRQQGYAYEFVGDELFDSIPAEARAVIGARKTLLSDIGRACVARERLARGGFDYFIWMDADILVFDPREFQLRLEQRTAFCREAWVISTRERRIQVKIALNNSVSLYARGDPFLDFYIQACLNTIREKHAALHKLDLAIHIPSLAHQIYRFPLINNVPNVSPWVIHDLLAGGGWRVAACGWTPCCAIMAAGRGYRRRSTCVHRWSTRSSTATSSWMTRCSPGRCSY